MPHQKVPHDQSLPHLRVEWGGIPTGVYVSANHPDGHRVVVQLHAAEIDVLTATLVRAKRKDLSV